MKLFEIDGIKLTFDDNALEYIVDKAIEFKLGARGLRSICETIMLDAMFDAPTSKIKSLNITEDYCKSKLDKSTLKKLQAAV
jgi:ATP-dependent Clp protease ATP-binding subunit ClpX